MDRIENKYQGADWRKDLICAACQTLHKDVMKRLPHTCECGHVLEAENIQIVMFHPLDDTLKE